MDERASLGVPVAIVIAGALIAAAIYFGNIRPGTPPLTAAASPAPGPPITTIGDIRPVTADDHIRGASSPRVTVIEYSDLECPFCKQFHATLRQLLTDYPNQVRWVYRHFPLEKLHSQAPQEAVAAECAAEQGKFWEFIDLVFQVTPSNNGLDLKTIPQLAEQAGVANAAQFSSCLTSQKYAQKVAADVADARTAGGEGTPHTVIIGPRGQKVPFIGAQPYSELKKVVDGLLK